jgi:hypothetical protein
VEVTPYGATTLAKSDGSRQPSANADCAEAGRQLLTARAADVQRLFGTGCDAPGTRRAADHLRDMSSAARERAQVASPGPLSSVGGSGRLPNKCEMKLPSMDPRLRELAALSGLAAVGCGFHPSRTA